MRALRRGRWALLQVLPLTYRTRYHSIAGFDEDGHAIPGVEHFVVWRMWLGRVFHVDSVQVA